MVACLETSAVCLLGCHVHVNCGHHNGVTRKTVTKKEKPQTITTTTATIDSFISPPGMPNRPAKAGEMFIASKGTGTFWTSNEI